MSFSSDTKKELSMIVPEKKCCVLAEIAGFVRMNGTIHLIGGGRMNVSVTTEDPAAARLLKKMIQSYFDTATSIEIIQGTALRRRRSYRLTLDDENTSEQMLREVGLLTVQEGSNALADGIPFAVIKKKCCKRAYLRGVFMAAGSLSHPEKGYHLEIVCKNEYIATDLKRLMNMFKLNAKMTERKNSYVVYLKESERIVDFMNITGAHTQLLEFENIRILKDMRNKANRIVNCESANLDKSVNAAGRQTADIKLIMSRVGLENLPPKLREAAELRLENPSAQLSELGAMLDPPVSKSGINHRLARISELAERLRQEATGTSNEKK